MYEIAVGVGEPPCLGEEVGRLGDRPQRAQVEMLEDAEHLQYREAAARSEAACRTP